MECKNARVRKSETISLFLCAIDHAIVINTLTSTSPFFWHYPSSLQDCTRSTCSISAVQNIVLTSFFSLNFLTMFTTLAIAKAVYDYAEPLLGAQQESVSLASQDSWDSSVDKQDYPMDQLDQLGKEPDYDTELNKARSKRSNIVQEVLDTERTYSSHLKLVVEVCEMAVMKKTISKKEASTIFMNIKPIYGLSQFIMQSLPESTEEALGDVIGRLAPFLKLYSTYTSGFEDAMKTLTEVSRKNRKFGALVKEFEKTKISSGLGLSSFMLEPVQRIPRYRLLLLDYLKYLPPDSPDKIATEKALKIISEAADLSNNRIKDQEESNELLAIQRSLVDYKGTLLVPSRSFIMKGILLQPSRKCIKRYVFFLFSDVLIQTTRKKNKFKFVQEIPLHGLQVDNFKYMKKPFCLRRNIYQKSIFLIARSEDERIAWISALQDCINNENTKKASLKLDSGENY